MEQSKASRGRRREDLVSILCAQTGCGKGGKLHNVCSEGIPGGWDSTYQSPVVGGHLVCLRNKEEVGRAEQKSQGRHERREAQEGWMDRWTTREWGGELQSQGWALSIGHS